jgi:hypothetical protein
MKGKSILAVTLATGLALPTLAFAQTRSETSAGGTNDTASATSTTTEANTDTGKTKKKNATSREARKNRPRKAGTEPAKATSETSSTEGQAGTTGVTTNVPTAREPGHRHSMNSLGGKDSLQNPQAEPETNTNAGGGH